MQRTDPVGRSGLLPIGETHEMFVRSRTRRPTPNVQGVGPPGSLVSVLRPASAFWRVIAGDALNPLPGLVFQRNRLTGRTILLCSSARGKSANASSCPQPPAGPALG